MPIINILRKFDYILMGATIILVVFGVLMIRSATMGAVADELISRVPNQIQYALIGFGVVIVLTLIDYRLLGSMHTWLYLGMMVLLLLVPIIGQEGDGGAKRWINLGILIQPSEIAKLILIVTLGQFLAQRYTQMDKLSTVIASLIHLALPAGMVFLQPDLGTTIVFAVLWFVLVWAAGLRLQHIALGIFLILMATPVIWAGMQDYQRARILTFVTEDTGEETQGNRYNIRQAAISIGSGGLVGKGYANGSQTQLRFLRVRHTDFIFSVIAEELGLVGGVTVMGMIMLVIMRILRGARLAVDPLGSMICYGVAAMIFFQTTVSIGMNLGLLPVTGLTLPFISSGGTSLLSMLAGIGLAQSVIVRRRRI